MFVCWETDIGTEDANTCLGDSGAPLLVAAAEGAPEVAAITSGGYNSCDRDDLSFDTAIGPHLDAITAMSVGNLSTATLGEVVVRANLANGRFDASVFSETLTIDVADGMSRLVVVGNADDGSGNRYSLGVRRGAQPTDAEYDCRSELPGVFQACTLQAPGAGTWYATYRKDAGAGGEYQLSATAFGPLCSLDVDGNGLFDALTDGILLIRYLFGFRGETLTDEAIGNLAWRASPEQIVGFLDAVPCLADLDVDGNGVRETLTDGLLAIRYLFGFSGDALVDNAVGAGATRTTPAVISDWLQRLER